MFPLPAWRHTITATDLGMFSRADTALLPAELQRVLTQMRGLDEQAASLQAEIDAAVRAKIQKAAQKVLVHNMSTIVQKIFLAHVCVSDEGGKSAWHSVSVAPHTSGCHLTASPLAAGTPERRSGTQKSETRAPRRKPRRRQRTCPSAQTRRRSATVATVNPTARCVMRCRPRRRRRTAPSAQRRRHGRHSRSRWTKSWRTTAAASWRWSRTRYSGPGVPTST